jgi:sugar lactone lactonase YvrE
MLRRSLAVLLALAVVVPLRAAQPQFWRIEGARDFLEGELSGVAVDSEGRLRLGPALRMLHDAGAPAAWSLARDSHGVLYVGTGNDGKVLRVEDGKASVLYDAPELEVHALAVGPDGRVYAGTSPDGKVYAIDSSGKAEVFYDPSDRYIWALAFDGEGRLFVATGADGRVHRVSAKGTAQVVFTSSETHVLSLAADARGNVYAGTSPGGIVYRIDPALKVFALFDSPFREVKGLVAGADGSVYAALVDGKESTEPARAPAVILPPPTPVAPEGFSPEGVTMVVPSPPMPAPAPRAGEPARAGSATKGALVRLAPGGEIDTLWSSSEEVPHALAFTPDGVLVGTGNRGKLFRVRDDRTWSMVATLAAEQVTALLAGPAKGAAWLATSNAAKLFELDGAAGTQGTFTSTVKDTDTVSSWGRLRWEATLPSGTAIELQTRTGNSGTPDTTWSDWSAASTHAAGEAVASERARFIQLRATLKGSAGASPVLDTIHTAYLQRNLRPSVVAITVHPPGEVYQRPLATGGEMEILGLEPGQPLEGRSAAGGPGRTPSFPGAYMGRRIYQRGLQTFQWRAEDPNGDPLVYDVHYRAVGDSRWRQLRKGLSDAVLAWDTSTVPNGRYVIRVTASDAPGNPPDLALQGELESTPFDVDNTPPVLTAALLPGTPPRVRASVRDESSLIRRTDYSLDGGRWQEVLPVDGINDSAEETYEITPAIAGTGPHILVLRSVDLLGNVATARVELPERR